jgi:hypothetical protein
VLVPVVSATALLALSFEALKHGIADAGLRALIAPPDVLLAPVCARGGPGVVMDEMGHADPALARRIHRQSMRRGEDEKAVLRALAEGDYLAVDGSRAGIQDVSHADHEAA